MQNAKDTFYEVMRARLAAINPDRTAVIRGGVQPAVIVEENELALGSAPLADCFRIRWLESALDAAGAFPEVRLRCEFAYESAGSKELSGTDRGRVLTAMDAELVEMVNAAPQRTVKKKYSGPTVTTMTTYLWWSDVTFSEVTVDAERVGRTASVTVMSFEEAGER